jgi:hypothetical protein
LVILAHISSNIGFRFQLWSFERVIKGVKFRNLIKVIIQTLLINGGLIGESLNPLSSFVVELMM